MVLDLRMAAERHLQGWGADDFVAWTLLAPSRPASWLDRLVRGLAGGREHAWLYDGASLADLVVGAGFRAVQVMPPSVTRIRVPGALDVHERAVESVYLEATKPCG